jgi:crotonobetainyl-CoA:carnitine CoA-transferase CaiB-like acyl-CoA transferase
VLAGPIGSRFLAAYGADVIRIDPVDFFEPNSLLIETTRGKRTLALNLNVGPERKIFEKLLQNADILIHGFRPGAMEHLGYTPERIVATNPGIVIVRHNAYGWTGPWSGRRGFDSLIQMSSGIAYADACSQPKPLPAQALDYSTGYLIAAAACRGMLERYQETRLSLARTAAALTSKGQISECDAAPFADLSAYLTRERSDWGPVTQLKCPGTIGSILPRWKIPAGTLGKLRNLHW